MTKRRNRNYRNNSENSFLLMVGLASIGLALAFIVLFPNQFNNIKDLINAAGKGGSSAFPTGPVQLAPTGIYRASFPDGTQCYSEDNISDDTFQGDMAPGQVFIVRVPMCGGGNPGIFMKVSGPSGLTLNAVTDPDVHAGQSITYPAHDLGIINRQYVQSRCFFPPWGGYGGVGGQTNIVISGYWKLILTNTNSSAAKNVTFHTEVEVDYPANAQRDCPREDWTFIPPTNISPNKSGSTVSGSINLTIQNALGASNLQPIGVFYTGNMMNLSIIGTAKGNNNTPPGTYLTQGPFDSSQIITSYTFPWDTRTLPNGIYTLTPSVPSGQSAWSGLGTIKGDPFTLTVKN